MHVQRSMRGSPSRHLVDLLPRSGASVAEGDILSRHPRMHGFNAHLQQHYIERAAVTAQDIA